MVLRLALLLALLSISSPAAAWWEYGHYSIARIAQLEARPATRAAIRRLIARSAELDTPTCPIRTIEDASYWPDCIKTLGDRFNYAYSWHYQNVDICKPFDLTAACKDGHCVSKQIERNAKLLADEALPARERLMALAFLVHFVGDLHQPLHAGDKSDRGGNDFKASYGVIASNLHAIWDGYLADRGISTPPPDAAGILSGLTAVERTELRGGTVEDWSREGWATAREFGYGMLMADPCGPLPAGRPTLDSAKIERLIPIVRGQVAKGGLRLARLLDEALS